MAQGLSGHACGAAPAGNAHAVEPGFHGGLGEQADAGGRSAGADAEPSDGAHINAKREQVGAQHEQPRRFPAPPPSSPVGSPRRRSIPCARPSPRSPPPRAGRSTWHGESARPTRHAYRFSARKKLSSSAARVVPLILPKWRAGQFLGLTGPAWTGYMTAGARTHPAGSGPVSRFCRATERCDEGPSDTAVHLTCDPPRQGGRDHGERRSIPERRRPQQAEG